MVRVLFISHAVELAGAEIALLRFIALLDRTRFEPLLLLPRHGALDALLGDIPVQYVSFEPALETEWTHPRLLAQIQPLHAAIMAYQPHLVVVNTSTIPQALIATLLTDIPLMVHLHAFIVREQFETQPASTRFAEELWLPFADHLVACSDWIAERYRTLLNRAVAVVPNTTPPAPYAPYPSNDTPLIVMLASLEDNKRPELFIRAAAGLRRRYPQLKFRCQLYGDGSPAYTAALQALVEQNGLQGIFSLHGRIADTSSLYQACAIVLMPSAFEAFSLVIIEAASYQRPVVATRCGGPETIVIDGETGLLIDVDDLDAAIKTLAYLLQHPARAADMGRQAYARYLTEYAPDVLRDHYQSALETAIYEASMHTERRQWAQPLAQYFTSLPEPS